MTATHEEPLYNAEGQTGTSKPPPPSTEFKEENAPLLLAGQSNWILWRPEWNGTKWTKVPYQVGGRHASATNPETWDDLAVVAEEARKLTEAGDAHGIGFVLPLEANEDGLWLTGIDFDHCINLETRELTLPPGCPFDLASLRDSIRSLKTYKEYSPSGDGLHQWVLAWEMSKGNKKAEIEIYQKGRFLTFTGRLVPGLPTDVATLPDELEALHAKHWPPDQGRQKADNVDVEFSASATPLEDIRQPSDDERVALFRLPGFEDTWERQRKDFKDNSGSVYGQAIANACVTVGLTMNHWQALEIEWRLKHDSAEPYKSLEPHYRNPTWIKAVNKKTSSGSTEPPRSPAPELPDSIEPDNEGHRLLVEEYRRWRLTEFNRYHAVVSMGNQARIVSVRYSTNRGGHCSVFRDSRATRELYANEFLPMVEQTPGKKAWRVKYQPIVDGWMAWSERKTFGDVDMLVLPGMVDSNSTEIPEPGYPGAPYNLYRGLAIRPRSGKCDLIEEHIFQVWCADRYEVYDYVIRWLAYLFQHPDELHTALLIKGGQGCGKGIIIDALVKVFGVHGTTFSDLSQLTSAFNGAQATSVLVYVNEATWGGNKSAESRLKSMITDGQQLMNEKFQPAVMVLSHAHFIFSSNEDWPVPVAEDDRRFIILDASNCKVGDMAWFEALANEIDNGGLAAFVHKLLAMDLSNFNPRVIPKGISSVKADSKLLSAPPLVRFLHRALEHGVLISESATAARFPEKGEWDAGPLKLEQDQQKAIEDEYRVHNVRAGMAGTEITRRKLLIDLKRYCGAISEHGKATNRPGYWELPRLDIARLKFNEAMGEGYEW